MESGILDMRITLYYRASPLIFGLLLNKIKGLAIMGNMGEGGIIGNTKTQQKDRQCEMNLQKRNAYNSKSPIIHHLIDFIDYFTNNYGRDYGRDFTIRGDSHA
jgi:hypothetical protein